MSTDATPLPPGVPAHDDHAGARAGHRVQVAAQFAIVVPFDVRRQLHAVVLLDGTVHAQAIRLPVGDRAGPCDQRGRLAVQGGAGPGRATGQQAEFTDRRADVGEKQPARLPPMTCWVTTGCQS